MREGLLRGAVGAAALALVATASTSSADLAPPAVGDILIATRGSPSSIVSVNALGGQVEIARFDGPENIGAFPSSIVYPGDGFLYATVDHDLLDERDRIVRIDPTTGEIVTLVDQTTAAGQLDSPTGIDIDPVNGDILFCQGGQVLRADPATGAVGVVSAFDKLGDLQELVVDAAGEFVYVVDDATDAVVRVSLADGSQTRVVTNQASVVDTILLPLDLVLDGDNIVAVSMINGLTRFSLGSGKGNDILRDPGSGNVAPGAAQGVDIDPFGSFVIVDSSSTTVYRVNPNGNGTVVSSGGLITFPQDVVVVGGADQSTGGPIGGGGGGGDCVLCDLGGVLSGKVKTKVKKVGKSKRDVLVDFEMGPTGATWSANLGGTLLSGTATVANKKGTKAVLTPDQGSVDVLLQLADQQLGDPESRPPLLLSRDPKITFKSNRKGTKGVLTIDVRVETDIGAKTRRGRLKAKLKGRLGGT